MSVGEHEEAARRDELDAARQQSLYDPSLVRYLSPCLGGVGTAAPCWTCDQNPSAAHLRLAALLRDKAARHRAESARLREAEATACKGLTDSERDISPFAHAADILFVQPLQTVWSDGQPPRDLGVRIGMRAVPGLTPERLQHQLQCHLARNAALGNAFTEASDPLDVPGATASVQDGADQLVVTVLADREPAGREIASRARKLHAPAQR